MKIILTCILFTLSSVAYSSTLEDRLKEIGAINSGSENVEGVTKVMKKVKPWAEELGFKVELRPNPLGEKISGPLFIAELAGEKKEKITFVMHADTVFEPSSPFQNLTMKSDGILQGPGVMDDKGGIVVGLEAIRQWLNVKKVPKYSLRIVITPNEENGGAGFIPDLKAFGQDSWLVLGLEPAYENGGIVIGRKGNLWLDIEVKGKEAHAGKHHKEGINACHILSEKIAQIQKLTNYKEDVTVSIGHMEGGQDKFNIVCGWARAKLDTRFPTLAKRNALLKKISKILSSPGVSYKISDDTPPFSPNKASAPFIQKYLKIIEKVEGIKAVGNFSAGAGDLNQFSREGLVLMDGLGPKGEHLHTEDEYLDLRSLETRSKILAEFLFEI